MKIRGDRYNGRCGSSGHSLSNRGFVEGDTRISSYLLNSRSIAAVIQGDDATRA